LRHRVWLVWRIRPRPVDRCSLAGPSPVQSLSRLARSELDTIISKRYVSMSTSIYSEPRKSPHQYHLSIYLEKSDTPMSHYPIIHPSLVPPTLSISLVTVTQSPNPPFQNPLTHAYDILNTIHE
jgi:hypothetical protein